MRGCIGRYMYRCTVIDVPDGWVPEIGTLNR